LACGSGAAVESRSGDAGFLSVSNREAAVPPVQFSNAELRFFHKRAHLDENAPDFKVKDKRLGFQPLFPSRSAPHRAQFTPQIPQCVPYSFHFSRFRLNKTIMRL
jgi:hypothetical protein